MVRTSLWIRIFLCYLFIFLPLENMDDWFYDLSFKLKPTVSGPEDHITLVNIDDFKLRQAIGKEKPAPPLWPRTSRRNYSKIYTEAQEILLNKILEHSPKMVVFTSFYERVQTNTLIRPKPWDVIFSAALSEENKLILPPIELASGANFGFSYLFAQQDGIIRSTRLSYQLAPSLALKAYERWEPQGVQFDPKKELWINYRGRSGSYPIYEAADIINSKDFLKSLKGKIVFIGEEKKDSSKFLTPMGKLTRLEIQANVIDNLIHQNYVTHFDKLVSVFSAALAVTATFVVLINLPLASAGISLISIAVFLFLTSFFILVNFNIWLPVATPLVCILITYLLMLGFKLSQEEEKTWKLVQESNYLKEMDQFKNNFISLFSHDLKTPISKIRAVVQQAIQDNPELDSKTKASLESIDATNDELTRTISDILKITKMETMPIKANMGVIDLNRLVEGEIKKLKFKADQKQIKLNKDLEPLFSLDGDSQLIAEIIHNLIENAIKYSPNGTAIDIKTEEKNDRVYLTVSDQGQGIPQEEIPRLTSKFYRGSRNDKDSKGSGLGLYLANYFVQVHHGELIIESEESEGSCIGFWLPLQSPEA